jgi:AcrR family transcriptional regulator
MSSRPYHHGDLRHALVEAALSIIDQEGVEALTIRRLARAVGVSHAAPAHHFADKTAIVMAVATEGFRIFGDHLEQASPDLDAGAPGHLIAIGRAYCRFAWDHPAYYRIMFGQHAITPPIGVDPEFNVTALRPFSSLMDAVMPLVARDGQSREEHLQRARAASLVAWSGMHGTVTLWQSALMMYPLRRWEGDVEEMVENAVRGMAHAVQTFREGDIPQRVLTPDLFANCGDPLQFMQIYMESRK